MRGSDAATDIKPETHASGDPGSLGCGINPRQRVKQRRQRTRWYRISVVVHDECHTPIVTDCLNTDAPCSVTHRVGYQVDKQLSYTIAVPVDGKITGLTRVDHCLRI